MNIKDIIVLILIILVALSLVGCSKDEVCWAEVETVDQYSPGHYRINGYDVGETGHVYIVGDCLPSNNYWRAKYN